MTDQLKLIPTVQPAEYCGDILDLPFGGETTECVLRPGHSGSHANETGTRWRLAAPERKAKLEGPGAARSDVGTEFIRQLDQIADATVTSLEAALAEAPVSAPQLRDQVAAAIYEYRYGRPPQDDEWNGAREDYSRMADAVLADPAIRALAETRDALRVAEGDRDAAETELQQLREELAEARSILAAIRARVDDAGSLMNTSYVRSALDGDDAIPAARNPSSAPPAA